MKHIDLITISKELPNLDGYTSPEELREVRAELEELELACHFMAQYCQDKSTAMRHRLGGDIGSAFALRACLRRYLQANDSPLRPVVNPQPPLMAGPHEQTLTVKPKTRKHIEP